MIAKILKPTSKFLGVTYSQQKVNEGKGRISGTFNFPFSEMDASPKTYVAYLEKIVLCSDRKIKNAQFHAVISTKGREHDESFLKEISQKWMQKMGYGEQPYIIYFHGDTPNNHVHIISCRITKEGLRIDPYMEGRKAGVYIRELMNEDLKEKAKFDISDAMTHYSFSTEAQFRLLLERRGWKVREKDGDINLIKAIKQGSIPKADIIEKTRKYVKNENRIRQLQAIFKKYSSLPTEQFQQFMRENFGIDLVFHTAKGHANPYGYTVIDHHLKSVMKGSEILPMESLLEKKSREEHHILADEIIRNTLSKNPSFSELKKTLQRNGYRLQKDSIFIAGDNTPLFRLSRETYKRTLYNDRLAEANKFTVHTKEEALTLSHYLYVKASDILLRPHIPRDDTAYREMSGSFANRESLTEYLKENKQALISFKGNTLIVDERSNVIANVSGLGLEEPATDLAPHYERNRDGIDDFMAEATATQTVLGTFIQLLETPYPEERDYTKKKRRKKQLKL
jgi:hypothetical protein